MTFLYILLIIIFCIILVKGADIIVKTLVFFANYLKLSKFVIAFILAGLATSLPEIIVSISSGVHKSSSLSLGNILGSNIANITLILGLIIILVKGISTEQRSIKINMPYVAILLIYPLLLLSDGTLSQADGLALIALFTLYLFILFRQKEKFSQTYDKIQKKKLAKNIWLFILGSIILILSAEAIVKIANIITLQLNIPLIVIGLFLVAIGTSLPEFSFSLRAAKLQSKEMILGNILGSLAANSTLALGITAIISPIVVLNPQIFLVSACFMVASFFLFVIFTIHQKKLVRKEGLILIFFYIIFIIVHNLIA